MSNDALTRCNRTGQPSGDITAEHAGYATSKFWATKFWATKIGATFITPAPRREFMWRGTFAVFDWPAVAADDPRRWPGAHFCHGRSGDDGLLCAAVEYRGRSQQAASYRGNYLRLNGERAPLAEVPGRSKSAGAHGPTKWGLGWMKPGGYHYGTGYLAIRSWSAFGETRTQIGPFSDWPPSDNLIFAQRNATFSP